MSGDLLTSREQVRISIVIPEELDCLILYVPSNALAPAPAWGSAELTADEARALAAQLLTYAAAIDPPAVDKPRGEGNQVDLSGNVGLQ